MEISDVKKKLLETVERARRTSADRRARADEAGRAYAVFLDTIAVPLLRQIANVLRAEGYLFQLFTPGGSVRLMSERSQQDFIELTLDSTGDTPVVMGRVSRARGSRVLASESPIRADAAIEDLTEQDVLAFVMRALEPFVEK